MAKSTTPQISRRSPADLPQISHRSPADPAHSFAQIYCRCPFDNVSALLLHRLKQEMLDETDEASADRTGSDGVNSAANSAANSSSNPSPAPPAVFTPVRLLPLLRNFLEYRREPQGGLEALVGAVNLLLFMLLRRTRSGGLSISTVAQVRRQMRASVSTELPLPPLPMPPRPPAPPASTPLTPLGP